MLSKILNDPEQAPKDVEAAINWLKADGKADPERIAIVGTSIGANLACVANIMTWVKLSVALSPRDTAVANLAGNPPIEIAMKGLYCIAGAQDSGGDQAKSCEQFVMAASEPKKSVVLPATSAHGVAIITGFPEEWAAIVAWLEANL